MFHVAQLLRMDGRRAAGWFMTVPRALAPQMLQTQMEIREAVPHVGPCGWILDLGSLGSSACAHTHATGHTLFHDTQVGVLAVMLICFIPKVHLRYYNLSHVLYLIQASVAYH